MDTLSGKRKRILDFISSFVNKNGYAPSVRDIVKGCSLSSTSIAQHHLAVLERKGHIRRNREIPRSITLSSGRKATTEVPVLGTIAAGESIPVPSSDTWHTLPEETLDVPNQLVAGKENVYALRVKGSSMIDALIDDGDLVLMQQARTAESGEMVALWLKQEQEVTLKRIYQEPGRVRLQPANRQMQPTYHDPHNIEVQGKVIGVIRKFEPAG
jgi:repressor LexA